MTVYYVKSLLFPINVTPFFTLLKREVSVSREDCEIHLAMRGVVRVNGRNKLDVISQWTPFFAFGGDLIMR